MPWFKMPIQEQWTDDNDVNAAGYVLKAYLPGTTTSTPIAIDKAGATTVSTVTLNADGLYEVSGNEVVPYIDREFKYAIFRDATDAAANSSPYFGFIDNVKVSGLADNISVDDYTGLKALTVADYSDGDPIVVRYRTSENDGAGGIFHWDTSDLSTEVTADTQEGIYVPPDSDATGASGAFVRQIDLAHYNAKWFGAVADGTTDDRAKLIAADVAAAAAGVPVFLPPDTYGLSVVFEDPMPVTASWYSTAGGATLKNTNLSLSSDTVMVQVVSGTDLFYDKIHLDGQITTTGSGTPNLDHGTPSDSNVDDYTRCAGWQISGGSNITVKNCNTDNIFRASFRGDTDVKGLLFENCNTNRNRGTFGDPYYAQNVRNTKYVNCRCYDYTRIGYVYEGTAGSNTASDFVSHIGCYAEYAHDNFTGENSCGFWVENCNEYHIHDCHAINTVGGFVMTATDSLGAAIANNGELPILKSYNMSDCTAVSVKAGLNINPDDKQAVFNITNFNAHLHDEIDVADLNGTATQFTTRDIISAQIGSQDVVINIANCGGYIPNANYVAAEGYGFLGILQDNDTTTQKIINLTNCMVEFQDAAKVRTDAASGGGGKGFYHSNGSTGIELHMTSCHELTSANDALSISVTTYDNKQRLHITDCRPEFIKTSGDCEYVRINDCDYVDCVVTFRADKVRVANSDCNLLGFNSNDVRISNCEVSRVVVSIDDPHTRYDGFTARGCNFNGDLSANATCLFQQDVAATRVYLAAFFGCTFNNSAGATNTHTFIEFTENPGGLMGTGNIIDDRVTNYADLNGSLQTAPKTDTDTDVPFGLFYTIDS